MTFSDLRLRTRALLFRSRVEVELQEELSLHAELARRKHRAAGLSDAEADRRARARFGSAALAADECRDARGIGGVEAVIQDVRYALRSFRRAPTFALTIIVTIALGLGLNTAVFTIFNAYVLKPFAVRDPYSLYEFQWRSKAGQWHRLSWSEYQGLGRETNVFSDMFGERHQLVTRVDGHMAYALLVTGNYFRMLGAEASLGRMLEPSDTAAPGGTAVVVISHALWTQRFGADPGVIGRKILVQGFPVEIVGVACEGFVGINFAPSHDLWLPITLDHQLEDGPDLFGPDQPSRVGVVGRLAPGVSVRTAEAALLAWAQATTNLLPPDDRAATAHLEARATTIPLSPMVMLALSPIAAGFGLVLLIACANVANMMLARGMARQREIGIRLTLGAGRSRLVRQLLTESVILAVPAALVGFAISRLAVDGSVRVMFATLPPEFTEYIRVAPLPPDVRVFAFMVVAAVATAVLFGLAPALQTTRSNIVQTARGDFGSDYGPWRLRSALVVAQIAASVTLLITSAVLVRSAQNISGIEPGVRTRGVISLDVRDASRSAVVAALAAHPTVTAIASASTVPFDATAPEVGLAAEHRPTLLMARYRYVSPSFFDVFDLPIVAGRTFTTEEAASEAAVAIVSDAAASALWPGEEAVGRRLRIVPEGRTKPNARIARYQDVQVIGVSRNTGADLGKHGPMRSAIHFPSPITHPSSGLIIRVAGESEAARRAVDAALNVAVPGAVQEIHKLEEFVAGRVYPFRAAYWVASAIGLLALALTMTGVYGVLSYLVAQRAKEISIRVALGANASSVVALIVRYALRLSAIGLPAGTLMALGVARIFGWRVIMLKEFDPASYLAGTLLVVTACVVASCIPALRAARIDPMHTLRAD